MSKNILLIASGLFNAGGIERYNQNLAKVIIKNGYSIKIISKNDIIHKSSAEISYSSYGHIKNSVLRKIFFSITTFRKAFSSDIIMCGHINFSPLCFLISKLLRKKYMVLTYGIDVWSITDKMKKKALKEASLVITISNFTKDKIMSQFPEIKNKIQLLPPPIDGERFYPKSKSDYLMNRHELKKDDKILLTITRLKKTEGYKGYNKILKALPAILKKFPTIKYILIGPGDDLENIQNYIKKKNLSGKVILTGYIPDKELLDYYNLCDIFVMPSKGEGFGIVFLEALACGKPVIAGNKDGSRDALLDGELGILVDPDNIDEIAETIVKVLKKDVPEKLLDGKYLRKRVLEVYGFDKFKERVRDLLRVI